jgi:hypothetical protein
MKTRKSWLMTVIVMITMLAAFAKEGKGQVDTISGGMGWITTDTSNGCKFVIASQYYPYDSFYNNKMNVLYDSSYVFTGTVFFTVTYNDTLNAYENLVREFFDTIDPRLVSINYPLGNLSPDSTACAKYNLPYYAQIYTPITSFRDSNGVVEPWVDTCSTHFSVSIDSINNTSYTVTISNTKINPIYIRIIAIFSNGNGKFFYTSADPAIISPSSSNVQVQSQINDFVSIYPNPASSLLHIIDDGAKHHYTIYSMLGQEIKNGNQEDFNVSNITNGSYYITNERGLTSRFEILR